MIYIRADANEKIGIGHMMRCFSIAKALRRMGTEATFFVADKTSAKMAAEAGFGYACLSTDYDHMDQEADKLLQFMRERCADHLLVDSYFVTENYLRKIREIAKLAYIDDVNKFIYPCDLLINYNIYAEQLAYPERYKAAGLDTKFALGLNYMPLRDTYVGLQHRDHAGTRILVTTGATDHLNVLGNFLRAQKAHFADAEGAPEIYGIVGRYNEHRDALREEFGDDARIHLIDPQPDLTRLIADCDIAVTAGGTTVYELCAGGIPSVMLTIADNQRMAAKEFSARDIIPYAGDVRGDMQDVMTNVITEIDLLMRNPEFAKARSEAMRQVVDGEGAERIAKALLEM